MAAILTVRLTTRGGRNVIDRVENGVVFARVAASPVKGAANEALCALLSREIGIPKSAVSIRSGATARLKSVELIGVDSAEALTILGASGKASD